MGLYNLFGYPAERREVSRNIVDVLVSDEKATISKSYICEADFGRYTEEKFIAINYGKMGNRNVQRGFKFDGKEYKIDPENKLLIPTNELSFWDADKIPDNNYMFEGDFKEFIDYFFEKGYSIY